MLHRSRTLLRSYLMVNTRLWRRLRSASGQTSRPLSITCRGEPISRHELFQYTNGRFLVNEEDAIQRRSFKFNVDQLCAIASHVGRRSPVCTIVKMEGGFSRALLLRRADGSELVAKLPFKIAGPAKYTTAAEVAVLQYVHQHTKVPVPKVLAWSSDASNPVGSEYIIMEKAGGTQLVQVWSKMADTDHFLLIKNLCAMLADMANIKFPASGALYLQESMSKDDHYVPLPSTSDPAARFCIGPSCDRTWSDAGIIRTNNGPWPDLQSFGGALARRELMRIKAMQKAHAATAALHGTLEDQLAGLRMAEEVMGRMSPASIPGAFAAPTLWHTDLHLGNIYVSNDDPTQIVSLIDWQGVVISPILCQVRFPPFLTVNQDYQVGNQAPRLPGNIDEMAEEERQLALFQHKQHSMAKIYEGNLALKHKNAHRVLQLPAFFRELFVRCGEVSTEGVIPLRECFIHIREAWKEAGFLGECPISFSDQELARHGREFEEYEVFHRIREGAQEFLGTDSEGWFSPAEDFEQKKLLSLKLRQQLIENCAEYGKTPDEIRAMWPF